MRFLRVLLLAVAGLSTAHAADPTLRQTTLGAIRGLDYAAQSGTWAWLGVPYAQPPVGALRWQPTAAVQPWSGTRDATRFGPACAQGGRFFSPSPAGGYDLSVRDGFGKPVGSEDCLTLNVWRPASAATNLPVVLFIHGGSNISGYSADPIYDGQVLAKKANAVVVTINYRLGMFGWFDLAQLKTGDPVADSGNFGLLDQIEALRFVQRHIGAFGGDASNVTVMGESAGAVNIWALLVSPLTPGLMHKAVPLSGGIAFATKPTAQKYANTLLVDALIADGKATDPVTAALWIATHDKAQVAAFLRSKSASDLIKVELADTANGTAPAVIPDGAVVPLVAEAAIAAGQYRRIPVLAGNTREEGKLFGSIIGAYVPNDYDRFTMQFRFEPDAPPTLVESDLINPLYLPVDKPVLGWNTLAGALTLAVFDRGLIASMTPLKLHQPNQVWYYRFAWNQEPKPFDTVYGAAHAMDLPFVFGNFGRNVFSFAYGSANRPGREALSDAMIKSLAAFMRTGNPNDAMLGVPWPNWPGQMVFDATKTTLKLGN